MMAKTPPYRDDWRIANLNNHSNGIKGKLEAVIYAAEEPVTLDQLMLLLKDSIASEGGLTGRR